MKTVSKHYIDAIDDDESVRSAIAGLGGIVHRLLRLRGAIPGACPPPGGSA